MLASSSDCAACLDTWGLWSVTSRGQMFCNTLSNECQTAQGAAAAASTLRWLTRSVTGEARRRLTRSHVSVSETTITAPIVADSCVCQLRGTSHHLPDGSVGVLCRRGYQLQRLCRETRDIFTRFIWWRGDADRYTLNKQNKRRNRVPVSLVFFNLNPISWTLKPL